MRRWIYLALLSVFFVSPVFSIEPVRKVVAWRFRNAVSGCLLEAGRVGVVDRSKAYFWHTMFCDWMERVGR